MWGQPSLFAETVSLEGAFGSPFTFRSETDGHVARALAVPRPMASASTSGAPRRNGSARTRGCVTLADLPAIGSGVRENLIGSERSLGHTERGENEPGRAPLLSGSDCPASAQNGVVGNTPCQRRVNWLPAEVAHRRQ